MFKKAIVVILTIIGTTTCVALAADKLGLLDEK